MKKSFIAVCLSLAVSLSGSVYAQNYASDAVYYPSGSSVQVKTVGLEQNLQGSWFGTNGKDSMLLIFMNNMVGMALNGQQIYGNFTVNGNQLVMRFQNGKSLSYNMNLNGDVLVLDNSITLNRQQAGSNPQIPQSDNGTRIYQDGQTRDDSQSQNNGGWGGGSQGQSSGGWGGSDNSGGAPKNGTWGGNNGGSSANTENWGGSQGNNFPQSMPSGDILNGKWSCQTPQGEFAFVFNNGQYVCIVNGQQIETGMYRYDQSSGNFNFQITSGQSAGASGTNRVYVQGNNMSIQFQNGGQMNFVKSN